jgi:predicted kinase
MGKLVTNRHSYADILKGSMAQTQNKNQKNPTHEKPVPATVIPNNLDTETETSDCTPKEIYVEIINMNSPSQNKNQKNPTHEKPVPATVLPNNLDTETKTSDCTPKEIYVEIIKMSSPSQNITPYPSNFQGTPAMPMPMGYEQFQPPSSNLNANNSKKIKIENDHSQNITPQQPNLQHVQGSPMPMRYEQFKPPQNNLNALNSGRIKIESEDFLIYDVPGDCQCFFHALSLAITGNLSQSLVYRSLICS